MAGIHAKFPNGSTEVLVALSMLLVLILRPDGLTGGKEVRRPAPLDGARSATRRAGPDATDGPERLR